MYQTTKTHEQIENLFFNQIRNLTLKEVAMHG